MIYTNNMAEKEITIGEAADMYGRVVDYWLAKPTNGKVPKVLCKVQVVGTDPKGNVRVRIVDSDEFGVKRTSLKI